MTKPATAPIPEKRLASLDELKAEISKRLRGLVVEGKDGSRVSMEDYLFESFSRRIAQLEQRNAELEASERAMVSAIRDLLFTVEVCPEWGPNQRKSFIAAIKRVETATNSVARRKRAEGGR